MRFRTRKRLSIKQSIFAAGAILFLLACLAAIVWFWWFSANTIAPLRYVTTIAGMDGLISEPFGIAVNGRQIYVSNGQNGSHEHKWEDTIDSIGHKYVTVGRSKFNFDGGAKTFE